MGRFKPDCHASDSFMNAVIVGGACMFQRAKRVLILSQRSKLCRVCGRISAACSLKVTNLLLLLLLLLCFLSEQAAHAEQTADHPSAAVESQPGDGPRGAVQ